MRRDDLRIDYEPLAEVARWPRNPKKHDKDAIRKSMQEFGFTQPLLRDEGTGKLVAGHGRIEVLEDLQMEGAKPPKRVKVRADGAWLVPVIRGVAFDSESEAERYVVTDNRLVEGGGWDEALLAAIFTDQGVEKFDGLGWDQASIDSVLAIASGGGGGQDTSTAPSVGADGVSNLHPGVGEAGQTFEQGTVRQVVLYFTTGNYEPALDRLAAVMRQEKLGNHTEVLLHLLDRYEAAHATGSDPASA